MLRATIELCPFGDTSVGAKKKLVQVDYWNTGYGTLDYADYGYEVHVYETTDDALVRARPENYDRDEATATITGTVYNFPRRALGSAHLLARVLADAGFDAEMAD